MTLDIGRRHLVAVLGGAAIAWPFAAGAQQSAPPVIGFLGARGPDDSADFLAAFRQGLNESGYIESQNVIVEYRWAEGHYDQLPALAVDLARRQVAVIFAVSPPAAFAAKAATTAIPIVFVVGNDPVQSGLVASLARPGGNLTGTAFLLTALAAKRLQVLHELVPGITSIGVIANPASPNTDTDLKALQAAAASLGLEIHVAGATSEPEFATALAAVVQQGAGALVVLPDPYFNSRAKQLVDLAARHALPAIYGLRDYVAAGGLMMYGASLSDAYHQAGIYTARILKGAKPADLPVVQSTNVELVINLKTAKALGLTVPLSVLGRADEVIE